MSFILTFDVGTTSVKTCLFDQTLHLVGYVNDEYELLTEEGGIVEMPPGLYWEKVKSGIKRVLETTGIGGDRVKIITITTQGETIIPVDERGGELRNAIVWLDGRAVKEGQIISERFSPENAYSVTGIPEINSHCPVSKILWLKNNEPRIYARTYKFLLLEDYLIFKFTGRFVTEKSLLSTTGYFDIVNDHLWYEVLGYMQVNPGLIPQPMECGEKVGRVRKNVAEEVGISYDSIVTTGAMDQVAAAVGAGNVTQGIITETTGTALVIAATTPKPDFNHPARVPIYRHALKGRYLAIPVCMTAGIILKWFKDEFCQQEVLKSRKEGIPVYRLLDIMAENVPPLSGGVLLLPYFTGTQTPHSNPQAKGVFYGISLNSRKENFVRAIFEAVGYMLRENIELVESMGFTIKQIRSLGGGANSSVWLRMKADITGKEVFSMEQSECASLGAAALGAFAVGMLEDIEKVSIIANRIRDSFLPRIDISALYKTGYRQYKNLYNYLQPAFEMFGKPSSEA